MPSVSQKQQAAAGIAHASQKGEIPKSELRGASKQMAKMPSKSLREFAKTKRKGLPMKKSAALQGYLEGYMNKFALTNDNPGAVPPPVPAPSTGQGGLGEWLSKLDQVISPNVTAPVAGAAGGAALGGLVGKKTALGGAVAGGLAGAAMSPAGMEILGRIRSALSSKVKVPA